MHPEMPYISRINDHIELKSELKITYVYLCIFFSLTRTFDTNTISDLFVIQSFELHIFCLENDIRMFFPGKHRFTPSSFQKIFCYLLFNQASDHLPRKFVNSEIVIIMCSVDSFVSSPKPSYFVSRKAFMYNVSDLIIIFDTPNIRIIPSQSICLARFL